MYGHTALFKGDQPPDAGRKEACGIQRSCCCKGGGGTRNPEVKIRFGRDLLQCRNEQQDARPTLFTTDHRRQIRIIYITASNGTIHLRHTPEKTLPALLNCPYVTWLCLLSHLQMENIQQRCQNILCKLRHKVTK